MRIVKQRRLLSFHDSGWVPDQDGRVVGTMFARMGLPAVVGEMTAGIETIDGSARLIGSQLTVTSPRHT